MDTVIRALNKNPDRKFIYVEMAFFSRWWRDQNNSTKELVRKFVDEGKTTRLSAKDCNFLNHVPVQNLISVNI